MTSFQRISRLFLVATVAAMVAGCSGGPSSTQVQVPGATLSPASLSFAGTTAGVTSAAMSTTLTNGGTGTLTIGGVTLTGANASSFAISSNTCGSSLAAGASCALAVTFTPGAAGSFSAAISVADNATGSPQTVSLSGTGLAPAAVTLTPSALAFGPLPTGSTSAAMSAIVNNSGGSPLSISGISLTGTNASAFSIAANTCGSTLAAGASCSVSVTFNPTAVAGYSAAISLADNASGTPQTVALSGTGVAPAAATFAPATLAFGSVASGSTSTALSTVLTNSGGAPMTISGISLTGTNAASFTISANTCGSALAASASCSISVTFSPAALAGYSAAISVADSAAGSPQTVTLTGTGVSAGATTFAPPTLQFPATGVGATATALSTTLTNSGGLPLTISSITLTGSNASNFAIVANTCGSTLAAGVNCSISVTFTPSAVASYSASISVADSATGSPQTVALSGNGVAPVATFTPLTLQFPATAAGATATALSTTLTNSGVVPMTISAVTLTGSNASNFAITANTCGSTLAAGANCSVSVTFTPSAVATYNAAISVADNATGSPQTVALSGNGAAPGSSFAPLTLTFPGTAAGTTATALSTTLTNSGGLPLTISGITITGSNAAQFAISATTCGSTLAAGANCSISATFTPVAAASFSAAISVADNAAGSPQTVALSGTGTASGGVTFAPTTLAFGGIANGTTAAALSTVLTNSGTGNLLINSVSITGTNASSFALSANTCGATLAAGASCSISVTFSPSATSSYAASLTVADSATGSPHTVALTGTGGVPTATISPASLTFGTIVLNATASAQNVTLTNTGSVLLTLTGATLGGTNAANFALPGGGTCGASGSTVAIGASCTIPVTFTPTSAVSDTATVSVGDNASGAPQTVTLAGTGEVEPNTCKSINNTSPAGTPPTANYAGTALSGTVKAGLVPVVGSSVQIYAAGTTGNGSAPTALGSPITTDSNGKFSLSASFTCPYSNSILYAVARGGVVNGGPANPGIVLAAIIGPCNSLTGSPSFTLNEATTTATAWAMAQFLGAGGNMGATATNNSGITLAAATAANLVNMVTGSGPGAGFPATGTVPTARLNSVGNLLNSCVASGGPSSTACTGLYTATNTSNTLDAVLSLVTNPGSNVATLFALSQGSTAYTPVLPSAPADWTLAVTYSGGGMKDPSAVSIDSKGNVFVANYYSVESVFSNSGTPLLPNGYAAPNLYESYGQAVDVNDVAWVANEESAYAVNGGLGSITQVTSGGTSPATFSSGGIYFPIAIAFDPSGDAWVADYGNPNAGVVVLSGTGAPLSGTAGYTSTSFDFPAAVATDSKCNGYLANQSSNSLTMVLGDGSSTGDFVVGREPSGVAVDANDNVWSANYFDNSLGLVTSGGKILSGTGITGGGLDHPQGIATDGAGHAWVANYRGPVNANAISEFATANAGRGVKPVALSPATGWGADAGLLEAYSIAIDASGNVWVTNFGLNTLTEFVGLAVPVKTPLLGPTRVP